MENWGLVLYQEKLIFFDNNATNEVHKELIARVVTHEIAHMWFGNLG
jgi:aminopeptidase N